MYLFADEAVVSSWWGPLLAIIGAAVASLFAYLGQRSKQQFDAEVLLMKRDLKDAVDEATECKEERKQLRTENSSIRSRLEVLERQQPPSNK